MARTSQVEKGNVEIMSMVKGRLFTNEQGRYQIKGTSYYFTSGDYIELFDEDTLEWLVGRIEHDYNYGYYAIVRVKVKGWCGVESKEEIYNLDNWIAKGI